MVNFKNSELYYNFSAYNEINIMLCVVSVLKSNM